MSTEPKKQNLVFTRIFNAPVEQVWRAWTTPEGVMQWWGPDMFSCPFARMDVRVGGTSIVAMRSPQEFGGGDTYNVWTYEAVEPHRRLVYVLRFSDPDGNVVAPADLGLPPDMPDEVRNEVTFKALDGGRTELTVTEYDWPVVPMMEMSKLGMEQCLDKMAAMLATS